MVKLCEQCSEECVQRKNEHTGRFLKRRFCGHSCSAIWQSKNNPNHQSAKRGADKANWAGGYRYKDGYKEIYVGRDLVGGNGYRGEHILIVERALGRRLKKGECVHHVNGVKDCNTPRNLLVCTNSYHRWFEAKMADLYKKEHFLKNASKKILGG